MNEAFLRLSDEQNISAAHLSLYWTLFQLWNLGKFQKTVSINRTDTMNLARIGSKNTYYKVLKDLEARGYIKYYSSKNPMKGSHIELTIFKTSSPHVPKVGNDPVEHVHAMSQNRDITWDNSVPDLGHQIGPSINSINNKPSKQQTKKREKRRESDQLSKTEGRTGSSSSRRTKSEISIPPSIDELKEFFLESESTSKEAENFFNYFESNGWLVGGKAKMKNWKAAARNWISRSSNFKKTEKKNYLDVNQDKDYSIPL